MLTHCCHKIFDSYHNCTFFLTNHHQLVEYFCRYGNGRTFWHLQLGSISPNFASDFFCVIKKRSFFWRTNLANGAQIWQMASNVERRFFFCRKLSADKFFAWRKKFGKIDPWCRFLFSKNGKAKWHLSQNLWQAWKFWRSESTNWSWFIFDSSRLS